MTFQFYPTSSKINDDFEIDIPEEIVEKLNINEKSILKWIITNDAKVFITIVK